MTLEWKSEQITGVDLTGSQPAANRTYALANANSVITGMIIVVANTHLQYTTDFTFSAGVITFLNAVWDNQPINLDYQVTAAVATPVAIGYTSTLQVVRDTGLGVEIKNENVGTGDASNNDFDLDNGNVIAGSYTLKYSTATTDNSFTSLTETTHYTIDKDGGTILLTGAGVSALASNILWADYIHSPKLSDTTLASFLVAAEKETDSKTGNYWGSVKTSTEIFDFRENFKYPTTDQPYTRTDWDEPDKIQLKNKSVQSLVGVYFLQQNVGITTAFRYDTTAGSYTEVTEEINTPGGTVFQPFADTTAANDYLYIGAQNQFHSIILNLFVDGVTGGTNTIQYYKNGTWTNFSPTESTTGVLDIEAGGKLSWDPLGSWEKVAVNSSASLYYIRIVANSTYSTEAELHSIYFEQDFVIKKNIPLYTITWSDIGTLSLTNDRAPDGNRIIRVDYQHGYAVTPAEINNLTSMYAGLRVYANITGGSYDDATGFQLGRLQISIGEVYVNVREVVRQFEIRINQILDDVGRKADVFVI